MVDKSQHSGSNLNCGVDTLQPMHNWCAACCGNEYHEVSHLANCNDTWWRRMQVTHWKACIGKHCNLALLCCTDASMQLTSFGKLANTNLNANLRTPTGFHLSLVDTRVTVHTGKRVKNSTSGKRG